MSKVLLVEDDIDLLNLTAYVLRRERYSVIEADDGVQAIRRWNAERPDLVVLDLGLPRVDGFDVIRRIRAGDDTPILVLSARKDAQDRMRAFNLGIDDFLMKPFEFPELSARIRAILRRTRGASLAESEPRVQVEDLCLDPESCEVTWRDGLVRLTPTEFRILYLLGANAGHVVPVNRLYEYVWGSDGADANALRSHISHLRRKLELCAEVSWTIVSAPTIGYVFKRALEGHVPTRLVSGLAAMPARAVASAPGAAIPPTAAGTQPG